MEELESLLQRYSELVARYHKTLDLVSDAGLRELPRHIADGLAYAELIERLAGPAATVVDVGSGAGLPGLVIAAALPEATVKLVERRRRRTAFLELAVGGLGLRNATVFGADVRQLDGVCADVVTAQAVAGLPGLVKLTRHVHRDPCYIVSRRGEDEDLQLDDVFSAAAPPKQVGQVEEGAPGTGTQNSLAGAETWEEPLKERGSLVAVRLPGGSACQP
jgi:16S rRNA (guanine527-N7)-methyltransferase